MNIILAFLLSYLLGSIPTAYIVGKMLKGIDIRHHGSGNIGATNTFRVLGKGPGIFVLSFDILKGLLAVVAIGDFLGIQQLYLRIFLGLVAIIGHNWTVFLKFNGGKGIATSLGVLIGLTVKIPAFGLVLGMTVGLWVIVFLASGFVSLASICAAVSLPILSVLTGQLIELVFLSVVCCLFIVLRHRKNIQRLFSSQESRFDVWGRRPPKK